MDFPVTTMRVLNVFVEFPEKTDWLVVTAPLQAEIAAIRGETTLAGGTKGSVEAEFRTLFEAGTAVGLSDGELLDLFLEAGGPAAELAFAALVEWHGQMVWRVCRDVLLESNDADDAFQATFLILARRARAIRKRSSLGPWLHGVALRVARTTRRRELLRRKRERVVAGSDQREPTMNVDLHEAAPILHEEVGLLPEKYRVPLVLCYFQGLTHDQAASQLGWPVGTVRSRMARARDRLRQRLLRRGVDPCAAILVATGRLEASAAVPATLVSVTLKMVGRSGAAGAVPASIATLVRMAFREMNIMRASMIAARVVAMALVGAAGVMYVAVAARSENPQKPATPKSNEQAPKTDAAANKIKVEVVQSKATTIAKQYVCKVNSRSHIDVRTLAEGYIAAIPVEEGQAVKKGDVLFEIVATLYKARLDADAADRDLAQLEFNNVRKLADKQSVSQDEVKIFLAKLAKAQAKVDLATAEMNFTRVKAPFDGLVGRPLRQVGSLVLKGETLASLSDNGSVWVYFNMSERSYLEYVADLARKEYAIELRLADGRKFPHAGKINAIEPKFNEETGTITFRAEFPNPDGLLHHGQGGMIVMNRVLEGAIVIPQRATFEIQAKRYVFVVDKDNVPHQREIVIQHEVDDGYVIKEGVGAGDKIVVDGIDLLRDGEKVY